MPTGRGKAGGTARGDSFRREQLIYGSVAKNKVFKCLIVPGYGPLFVDVYHIAEYFIKRMAAIKQNRPLLLAPRNRKAFEIVVEFSVADVKHELGECLLGAVALEIGNMSLRRIPDVLRRIAVRLRPTDLA